MKIALQASIAGLILSLLAFPAFADTNDIRAANRAIEFDVGAGNLKYGETNNGATFDTEKGWMPDLGVGLTWVTPDGNDLLSNTYLHIDGQVSFGDVDYNGGVQVISGGTISNFPFQTTTNELIAHVVGKAGHMFTLNSMATLTPYIDLGWRGWQRKILGGICHCGGFGNLTVGNSNETYDNYESGGGLLVQVSPMPRLVLSASGQIGETFASTMRSSGSTYNLGSTPVWQVAGRAGYAVTPSFELIADARFDGLGFDKSAAVNQGGGIVSYEPNSYTHQLTIMGGLAYHLK